MNRMMPLLQILGVIVVFSAFVLPPPSPAVDASNAVLSRASCASIWDVSHSFESSWISHAPKGATSDMESPPQGDIASAFLWLVLLCIAEEAACFDVCADQAKELSRLDGVSEHEAGEFYAECSSVCWNDCFGEEEKD